MADAPPPETRSICVVGSANLDIVVPVPHHPVAGETVMGGDHSLVPGGKGANQAVAAARLGGRVSFVGCVGDDDAGQQLTDSLRGAGVNTTHLRVLAGAPSGIAMISVAADGDNAIVVSPGANARLTAEDLHEARAIIAEADVVLLQLEVPLPVVAAAAAMATGTVILNPAPATPLPDELLRHVTILTPNETELDALGRGSSLEEKARSLGVANVVVTLGAHGALVVDSETSVTVASVAVSPVDTTGAGDSFCGALAAELAAGVTLEDAVRFAVRVGAATTLRLGAQSSLPTRAEVAERLAPAD